MGSRTPNNGRTPEQNEHFNACLARELFERNPRLLATMWHRHFVRGHMPRAPRWPGTVLAELTRRVLELDEERRQFNAHQRQYLQNNIETFNRGSKP